MVVNPARTTWTPTRTACRCPHRPAEPFGTGSGTREPPSKPLQSTPCGLLAFAVALGCGAYAAAWTTAQRWGATFSRLVTDEKRIPLTFDDGPSHRRARYVETLDQWGVSATYFLCGRNVQRGPENARDLVTAGHPVGNHTYSRPCLLVCSLSRVRAELVRTRQAIGEATGRRTALFRPPYGLRSPALRSVLPQLGLMGVYWTVLAKDYTWDTQRIASRAVGRACRGSIVCLHEVEATKPKTDRTETLRALEAIIPVLLGQGYSFVSLPNWGIRG